MSSATLTLDILSSTIVTADLIFAKISSGAKIVHQALTLFTNPNNNSICVPKSTLAEKLGMQIRTISKYLNELTKAGFLCDRDEAIIAKLPAVAKPQLKLNPQSQPSQAKLEGTEVFEALDNVSKDVLLKSLQEIPAAGQKYTPSIIRYLNYLKLHQTKENWDLILSGIIWCLNHAYRTGTQPLELRDLLFLPALKNLSRRIDKDATDYADTLA